MGLGIYRFCFLEGRRRNEITYADHLLLSRFSDFGSFIFRVIGEEGFSRESMQSSPSYGRAVRHTSDLSKTSKGNDQVYRRRHLDKQTMKSAALQPEVCAAILGFDGCAHARE